MRVMSPRSFAWFIYLQYFVRFIIYMHDKCFSLRPCPQQTQGTEYYQRNVGCLLGARLRAGIARVIE
jgi:hypothetical protein